MPMIDLYAKAGTFSDKRALAIDLATAVMRWEQVPEIALFANNTATFIHELGGDALATAAGAGGGVRVQVLTCAGALDTVKRIGVVRELTDLVAAAAGDPALADRTWVLIAELADGGWGIGGYAHDVDDVAAAARAELGDADRL
jgi:phenylpyruvate tautomerase PptA (4-oxalocrotonate tautomerase family)